MIFVQFMRHPFVELVGLFNLFDGVGNGIHIMSNVVTSFRTFLLILIYTLLFWIFYISFYHLVYLFEMVKSKTFPQAQSEGHAKL